MRGEVCRFDEHSTWQPETLFYIGQITFADFKYLSYGSHVGTGCNSGQRLNDRGSISTWGRDFIFANAQAIYRNDTELTDPD